MGKKPEGQHDRGLTAAPLARLRPTAALRADVAIVGAGPAGLLIANLLQQRGIDSIVVDKFTREQIHSRARAGFIEWRNRIMLERVGLADRMLAEGSAHGECEFRTVEGSYVLDYAALAGGRAHWVYPQQELVSDLTDSFLAGGGDIRFGLACVDVLDHAAPVALCEDTTTGGRMTLECQVLAGCDGFHGAVRASIPDGALAGPAIDHPFQWLTILAAAPPSSEHVIYAVHPNGFAAHMMRTPTVSRYYRQCALGDSVDNWPPERVWSELRTCLAFDRHPLVEGPLLERSMLSLRSVVFEPMQYRNTLLAGDAAHIITPCGGKGMNLALQDAAVLVELVERYLGGEGDALAEYTPRRLPDIWRAQEFSHWFLHMLNVYGDSAESGFLQGLATARLRSLEHHPEAAAHFATGYVGPE